MYTQQLNRRVNTSLVYLHFSEIMREVFDHCVVKVEVNYEEIDKNSLPLSYIYFITNALLTFNGLTAAGGRKLSSSLNFLKEYTLSQFQEKEWVGRPPPPYFSVITTSYLSFTKGLPFSKPRIMDEPYVLVMAWLTIAEAEHIYQKLLEERVKTNTHETSPFDRPPRENIQPKDLHTILQDKFSFPLPPIPTEK